MKVAMGRGPSGLGGLGGLCGLSGPEGALVVVSSGCSCCIPEPELMPCTACAPERQTPLGRLLMTLFATKLVSETAAAPDI